MGSHVDVIPFASDFSGDLIRLFLVDVGDGDGEPIFRQLTGNAFTDALRATSDDSYFCHAFSFELRYANNLRYANYMYAVFMD